MTSKSETVATTASTDTQSLHEAIRRRAEQIYIESGCIPGRDVQNWAQAEREVSAALRHTNPGARTAILVRVNGVQYVGEYQREDAGGYTPGEFGTGAEVSVRFEGERMFIKRPNGQELETTVVQKIG